MQPIMKLISVLAIITMITTSAMALPQGTPGDTVPNGAGFNWGDECIVNGMSLPVRVIPNINLCRKYCQWRSVPQLIGTNVSVGVVKAFDQLGRSGD